MVIDYLQQHSNTWVIICNNIQILRIWITVEVALLVVPHCSLEMKLSAAIKALAVYEPDLGFAPFSFRCLLCVLWVAFHGVVSVQYDLDFVEEVEYVFVVPKVIVVYCFDSGFSPFHYLICFTWNNHYVAVNGVWFSP